MFSQTLQFFIFFIAHYILTPLLLSSDSTNAYLGFGVFRLQIRVRTHTFTHSLKESGTIGIACIVVSNMQNKEVSINFGGKR